MKTILDISIMLKTIKEVIVDIHKQHKESGLSAVDFFDQTYKDSNGNILYENITYKEMLQDSLARQGMLIWVLKK